MYSTCVLRVFILQRPFLVVQLLGAYEEGLSGISFAFRGGGGGALRATGGGVEWVGEIGACNA